MDSAHHQNNNQPRHARRKRNKEYGNWKLGIWTKWDPYWQTIPYGWSIPYGKINGRDGNIKKCQFTTNTNNQPRLAKKLSKNEHSSSLS